jgi:hypothetical protein
MTEKTCTRCNRTLSVKRFAVKNYNPDGTPRKYQPACRACTAKVDRVRKEQRRASIGTVDGETRTRLPVGPISDLLVQQVERHGEDVIAARFGICTRELYRFRHREYPTVDMDKVDKMLCVAGLPGMLMELYPSIYVFDEDEQVAA